MKGFTQTTKAKIKKAHYITRLLVGVRVHLMRRDSVAPTQAILDAMQAFVAELDRRRRHCPQCHGVRVAPDASEECCRLEGGSESEAEVTHAAQCVQHVYLSRQADHVPCLMDASCSQISPLAFATHSAALNCGDMVCAETCRLHCGYKSTNARTRIAHAYLDNDIALLDGGAGGFLDARSARHLAAGWIFSPGYMSVPVLGVHRRASDIGAVYTRGNDLCTHSSLLRRGRRRKVARALAGVCQDWFARGIPKRHGPVSLHQLSSSQLELHALIKSVLARGACDRAAADAVVAMPVLCAGEGYGNMKRLGALVDLAVLLRIPAVEAYIRGSLLGVASLEGVTEASAAPHVVRAIRDRFVMSTRRDDPAAADTASPARERGRRRYKNARDAFDSGAYENVRVSEAASGDEQFSSCMPLGVVRVLRSEAAEQAEGLVPPAAALDCDGEHVYVCTFAGRRLIASRLCNVAHVRVDILLMSMMCAGGSYGRALCCCLPERIPLLIEYLYALQLPTVALEMCMRLAGVCSELQTGIVVSSAVCRASSRSTVNFRLLAAEECMRDVHATLLYDGSPAILAACMIAARAALGVPTFPEVSSVCPYALTMGRSIVPFISCPLVDTSLRAHLWEWFARSDCTDYVVRLFPGHPDMYDRPHEAWKACVDTHPMLNCSVARCLLWHTSLSYTKAAPRRAAAAAASQPPSDEQFSMWIEGRDPDIYGTLLMGLEEADLLEYIETQERFCRVPRLVVKYEDMLANMHRLLGRDDVDFIMDVLATCAPHGEGGIVCFGEAVWRSAYVFPHRSCADGPHTPSLDALHVLIAGDAAHVEHKLRMLVRELSERCAPFPVAVSTCEAQQEESHCILLPGRSVHLVVVCAAGMYSTHGDAVCCEDFAAAAPDEYEGMDLDLKHAVGRARCAVRSALLRLRLPHEKIVLVPQGAASTLHATARCIYALTHDVDYYTDSERVRDLQRQIVQSDSSLASRRCSACLSFASGFQPLAGRDKSVMPCHCRARQGERVSHVDCMWSSLESKTSYYTLKTHIHKCLRGLEFPKAGFATGEEHESFRRMIAKSSEVLSYLTSSSILLLSSCKSRDFVRRSFAWDQLESRCSNVRNVCDIYPLGQGMNVQSVECYGARMERPLLAKILGRIGGFADAAEDAPTEHTRVLCVASDGLEYVRVAELRAWASARMVEANKCVRYDFFTAASAEASTSFIAQSERPFGFLLQCRITEAVQTGAARLRIDNMSVAGVACCLSGAASKEGAADEDEKAPYDWTTSAHCIEEVSRVIRCSRCHLPDVTDRLGRHSKCALPIKFCITNGISQDDYAHMTIDKAMTLLVSTPPSCAVKHDSTTRDCGRDLGEDALLRDAMRIVSACRGEQVQFIDSCGAGISVTTYRPLQMFKGRTWRGVLNTGDVVGVVVMYAGAKVTRDEQTERVYVEHIWEPFTFFKQRPDVSA